jgi:hypothetical protein
MFAGQSPIPCGEDEQYVDSVHACVKRWQLKEADFLEALFAQSVCDGGRFTSALELQRLRFCSSLIGSIVIEDLKEDVDPNVFWDIEEIEGLNHVYRHLIESLEPSPDEPIHKICAHMFRGLGCAQHNGSYVH